MRTNKKQLSVDCISGINSKTCSVKSRRRRELADHKNDDDANDKSTLFLAFNIGDVFAER